MSSWINIGVGETDEIDKIADILKDEEGGPDPEPDPAPPEETPRTSLNIEEFMVKEDYLRIGETANVITKIKNNASADLEIFNAVYTGDGLENKRKFKGIEKSKIIPSGEIKKINFSVSYNKTGTKNIEMNPGRKSLDNQELKIEVTDNNLFLEEFESNVSKLKVTESAELSYTINNTGEEMEKFEVSILGKDISKNMEKTVEPGLNNFKENIIFEEQGSRILTISSPDRPTIETRTENIDVTCINRRNISRGQEQYECGPNINPSR